MTETNDATRTRRRNGRGSRVAAPTGDLQTKRELEVFLHRLDTAGS
jgi:hypothetical protein